MFLNNTNRNFVVWLQANAECTLNDFKNEVVNFTTFLKVCFETVLRERSLDVQEKRMDIVSFYAFETVRFKRI